MRPITIAIYRNFPKSASQDRKSTRLNSSHQIISYAVFCLKKKKLLIISPLEFLALAGIALRRNLLIAISSNLTFLCASVLLCTWYHWNSFVHVQAAALAAV